MFSQSRKYLLASSVAFALTAGSGLAVAQTEDAISNARLESRIATTFELSPYLRANNLEVTVKDGKATLTGIVQEDVNKDLAEQIALSVDGVKSVDNKIETRADHVAARDDTDRSFGEIIDDASITAAVKSKLLWSRHASGLSTSVDTLAGKVTLSGTADSGAARELAENLASNTNGVVSVDNQLTIVDSKSAAESDDDVAGSKEVKRDVSDTWITTKVKSTLMFSKNVSSSDISVTTHDGVVTLTGKVDSGAEQALAVELARNVRGVIDVKASALDY